MTENLTDQEIIYGLRHQNAEITRDFFYETCSLAYNIDNRKYGLSFKDGLDYYSLAHEYYLHLYKKDWKQLEEKKPNFTLTQWTINGFHYIVLDNLNKYGKGKRMESIEERAAKGKVAFDIPESNLSHEVEELVNDICTNYYLHDKRAQAILRGILIEGLKGKEVAEKIGISPAAVSQRFRFMMDHVVKPYFKESFTSYDMSLQSSIAEELPPMSGKVLFDLEEDSILDLQEKRLEMEPHAKKSHRWLPKKKKPSIESKPFPLRLTPAHIDQLQKNQIVVYGIDVPGLHEASPTLMAYGPYGAVAGQPGLNGQTFAIPTMIGPAMNMKPFIDELLEQATLNPEKEYLVTEIGCGIAGFTPDDIAPLFEAARRRENIYLPKSFLAVLNRRHY